MTLPLNLRLEVVLFVCFQVPMEILGHAMQTYNRLFMLQRTFRNMKVLKREFSKDESIN